jgi:hypothetical protein
LHFYVLLLLQESQTPEKQSGESINAVGGARGGIFRGRFDPHPNPLPGKEREKK